jgi:Domain of unknown function (DUF222)/HNH endonuclease
MPSPSPSLNSKMLKTALRPLTNAELAGLDNEALLSDLAETARVHEALVGREAQLGGEIARREAFRADGATSLEAWLAGHLGRSAASARALAHVGERLFDLPKLQEALSCGRLSFDQVRALVDVATPESDAEWAETAEGLPARDLAEMARRKAPPSRRRPTNADGPERPSLRCHDATSTLVASLPAADYVELKRTLEAIARTIADEQAELSHDERMGMALMMVGRSGGDGPARPEPWRQDPSPVVVAHVALEALLAQSSGLVGELERGGLISSEVIQRLLCDTTFAVALDDEAGHTMYEGRATRFPTETQRRELWRRDRHCRFPGCGNATYTNAHHIEPWTPAGNTDLDNLVTLCRHHHHEVHSKRWSISGDANVELTFISANDRILVSRPSPLWGKVL